MELIGTSSLWEHKYAPQTIDDVILADNLKVFFATMIEEGELSNLLFYSGAGTGKTTVAKVLGKELDCDVLYINAALQGDINTIRHDVSQFAMTHSLLGGKKLVILDEVERLRAEDAQEGLKVLIEQAEENCRFIFCTNNKAKIIDPLMSRLQPVSFYYNPKESEKIMAKVFKRILFILETEEVEFDKKIVAKFVQKMFPDIRKTINRMAMFVKMYQKIDEAIMTFMDSEANMEKLGEYIKTMAFNKMTQLVPAIPADEFFSFFFDKIQTLLRDDCKPQVILILGEYNKYHSLCADGTLNIAACCTELMKVCQWE
jgi:DNA polymerase III delta prime subunit